MVEKRTLVDQIEVTANGTIQVRMRKLIVEDGAVLSEQFHRTVIEPNCDCDEQLSAVNAHRTQMSCATVASEDWQRVRDIAQAAWA